MATDLVSLGERIAEQAAHLDAAMHRVLTDLREFDTRGGWHAQGALSCAHWLAWRVGWDLVTARERVRVARKLADHPLIDDALRRGEVSYSKVRAMLRVATTANEPVLLEYARLTTAAQLETLTRKYAVVHRHGEEDHPQNDALRRYVQRRDTEDGMIKIVAVLHPEEAEFVWAMLDHAAKRLTRDPGEPSTIPGVAAQLPSDAECTPSVTRAVNRPATAVLTEASVAWSAVPADHHDTPGSADSAESSIAELGDASIARATAAIDDHSVPQSADSAESSIVEQALLPTPAAFANLATAWSPDSPESRYRTDGRAGSHGATASPVVSRRAATLAEDTMIAPSESALQSTPVTCVSAPPAPGGSLLDRLLDEISAFERAQKSHKAVPENEAARGSSAASSTSALRQKVASTRRAFRRADALVWVAQTYLHGEQLNRTPIDVTLTVNVNDLRVDAAEPTAVGCIGDSFIPKETARRLSCDAGVIAVVESEHGVPLQMARKRRAIAGALKRALLRRDATCTFPGCTHRTFLEGHHIRHWVDGGETSLENAALLCSFHHRHVHEYGYSIELGPDGRPRFRDPSGRTVVAAPDCGAHGDVAWPRIRETNAPLDIDADTIACEWDGSRPDFGSLVGHLATIDEL